MTPKLQRLASHAHDAALARARNARRRALDARARGDEHAARFHDVAAACQDASAVAARRVLEAEPDPPGVPAGR